MLALDGVAQGLDDATVEARACHQQEQLAIRQRRLDGLCRARLQHMRELPSRAGKPDLVRQHVGGAEGDDTQWNARSGHGTCGVPDGAVAAGRDERIEVPAARGRPGVLFSLARTHTTAALDAGPSAL